MVTAKTATTLTEAMRIEPLDTETVQFHIVGTTPMICNRMSEKARRQLLLPRARMTAADKAANLKHNPLEEFRASPYVLPNENEPTLIAVMASAFKGAMATAALDLPGTRKTQIGRLVHVEGEFVGVYGEPYLAMHITRAADIDKTPDVRTRVIIPKWACVVTVRFVKPLLNQQGIANLLAAGGITSGVGDWRAEKGKGNFGQYAIVNADDTEFVARTAFGREVQKRMMAEPTCYDTEAQELLAWFDDEIKRKGVRLAA